MAQARSSNRTYSNDIVVGVDDKLDSIKDRLTRSSSKNLDVLSIVGMGGIGKTTVARKIYDDSLIADCFDVRAWTTISQKYELVTVLRNLMQQYCQGDISKIDDLESTRDVGEQLCKGLRNRRYLVVIDDIWDVEAWQNLRSFFPNDCNGSRIILTTRDVELAKYANPNYTPYELSHMDPDTSWELLSKKIFLGDSCPEELAAIGNEIALKCQGLPLAISVVAGHLSKVGRTYLDWHKVEKQLPSIQGNVLDILALSYNFLPVQLRKCFLFAANEYEEIVCARYNDRFMLPTKILTKIWIAAGYIHAEDPKTLEDVAEEYLQELTSRNLIIFTNKGFTNSYIVHDLMIDMCSRLDFEKVRRRGGGENCAWWKDVEWDRRIDPTYSYSHDLYPFALFCGNKYVSDRILQSISEDFYLSKWGHLKILQIRTTSTIPTSVYKLHNIETLINPHALPGENLPSDVWRMSKLRHLHVGDITYLPSPRQSCRQALDFPILKNLQSVTLSSASCTQEIMEGIPNVRRLKLYEMGTECNEEEQSLNCLNNLCFVAKLQRLRLHVEHPPRCLRHWKIPPQSLRKLTLEGTCLGREENKSLASLPNLEELKLKWLSVRKWRWLLECEDDIFQKLEALVIECVGLVEWEAYGTNFPNLRHLGLSQCHFLEGIPLDMKEIYSLQVIELFNCPHKVEESARKIQQEQCDEMGKEDFIVHIHKPSKDRTERDLENNISSELIIYHNT